MRSGVFLNLRAADIQGQKLLLRAPKCGREGEVVFLPRKISGHKGILVKSVTWKRRDGLKICTGKKHSEVATPLPRFLMFVDLGKGISSAGPMLTLTVEIYDFESGCIFMKNIRKPKAEKWVE